MTTKCCAGATTAVTLQSTTAVLDNRTDRALYYTRLWVTSPHFPSMPTVMVADIGGTSSRFILYEASGEELVLGEK